MHYGGWGFIQWIALISVLNNWSQVSNNALH